MEVVLIIAEDFNQKEQREIKIYCAHVRRSPRRDNSKSPNTTINYEGNNVPSCEYPFLLYFL